MAGRGLVSVRDVRELQAVVLAFARLPTVIRRQINQQTRAVANPIWKGEVERRLRTRMDQKVMGAGVRVKAGNPIVLQAAQSTRAIGGRLKPAEDWHAWEFGGDRTKVTTYDRTYPGGDTHQVSRHTARQLPARTRRGRVAYAAFATTAPRIASLWVQTVVRCVHDAAAGKAS